MRERVDGLLGERTSRARLHTFHSFSVDILRQHGSHLGLRPDFMLITQDEDRIAILDEILAEFPDYETPLPTDRINLLSLIDRLFADSYEGFGQAPSLVHTPDWLPRLFGSYCDTLLTSNRLDFGSLLHFARRLLENKPSVARVVQVGWTHVCVDEFQDTNKAQYDLLRLIAPDNQHNLFVVGDDDQIIYQWNGANPERLVHLQRDYAMEVIQLPECYRCPHTHYLAGQSPHCPQSRTHAGKDTYHGSINCGPEWKPGSLCYLCIAGRRSGIHPKGYSRSWSSCCRLRGSGTNGKVDRIRRKDPA